MLSASEKQKVGGVGMYGYTNEDGEPIMDGVAYRFEQQLDMDSMYDEGDYYDRLDRGYYDEPDPLDPSECEHGNGSFPEGAGFDCRDCEGLLQGPRTEPFPEAGWGQDWGDDFFVNYGD